VGVTCPTNGQRGTTTLNHELSTMWKTVKDDPSTVLSTINGTGRAHEA